MLRNLTIKIEQLSSTLSLKPDDIEHRRKVCNNIHKSLKVYYPECQLLIYGSTLNGYGIVSSDLDLLFIPSPGYHAESHSKVKKEDAKSPTVYEIRCGRVAKEELLHLDRETQLCFVRRVLRHNRTFQKVLYIAARCPIIHFQIPYLKISCDISCGSSHVVCNTQLLRFYNEIDNRLQPLVIALRFWGKSLGFILSGILSSYAFTLLVVFFLQNVEPPVLPTVKHLQDLADFTRLEDGWNVAFTSDLSKLEKSQNTKSVGELFREFFCFCGNFDFSNYVICPNTGIGLPIKSLIETTDERLKEFEISPMCIQDPFLLSCNTSRNMKMPQFYFFRQAVYLAVKIIDGPEFNDNFGIVFSKEKYDELCKKSLIPPISEKSVSFPLNIHILNSLRTSALGKQMFYEAACSVLFELLQYGLLFECEVVNKINLHNINMEEKDNPFLFVECIQCAVYNRTFVGRAKLKEQEIPVVDSIAEQFNNSIIKNEFIISNYLIQQNPLLTSPRPFSWIYCDVYLSFLGRFENLIIVLTPLSKSKETKSLFTFLQSFVEKNLSKALSEHFSSNGLTVSNDLQDSIIINAKL